MISDQISVTNYLRPRSLREFAERSVKNGESARNLRKWFCELGTALSRNLAAAAVADERARSSGESPEDRVADRCLAACAELLAGEVGILEPEWAFLPRRVAEGPMLEGGDDSRWSRTPLP